MIRSVESSSLHVLRAIEDEAIKGKTAQLNVFVSTDIAFYIFNNKRAMLQGIESSWKIAIYLLRDDTLVSPDYRFERVQVRREALIPPPPVSKPSEEKVEAEQAPSSEIPPSSKSSRSRSRRRFRKGDPRSVGGALPQTPLPELAREEDLVAPPVIRGPGIPSPIMKVAVAPLVVEEVMSPPSPVDETVPQAPVSRAKPKRRMRKPSPTKVPDPLPVTTQPTELESQEPRKGWWQRLIE